MVSFFKPLPFSLRGIDFRLNVYVICGIFLKMENGMVIKKKRRNLISLVIVIGVYLPIRLTIGSPQDEHSAEN
jgi:hypothetical protein